MKAITVRQPWAWAIASGAKTVENRTRSTTYRGPLAIHAGLGWSDRGMRDDRVRAAATGRHLFTLKHGYSRRGRPPEPFRAGCVIAIAQLVDAHPDTGCCRPWGESSYAEAGGRTRTTIHHLVLEDIRPLPTPLPARGALGLRLPDPDLHDALIRSVAADA